MEKISTRTRSYFVGQISPLWNSAKLARAVADLEAGDLHTARGRVWFRLISAPVFSLFSSKVGVQATMCLDCGDVKLTGDATRAREVLRK